MSINRETVLKTAKLARLNIKEDQVSMYAEELSKIIDIVDSLQEVDTDDIEPLVNVNESELTMREDKVTDGNSAEKILKNAPKEKFEYFIVPKVIE
jgi:aspartyl-tRNA(Asn)/glutamyl-tRNA(Gln) amidotransferase subunit C